jgi:transglutaminase-like putative cysteine protease
MLYDLKLRITHEYPQLAGIGRHMVRIAPLVIPGRQSVHASYIHVAPLPFERSDGVDFYGNSVVAISHIVGHEKMVLSLTARVECFAQDDLLNMSPCRAGLQQDLEGETQLDGSSPLHFVGRSPRLPASTAITEYAERVAGHAPTVFEMVTALGQALHRDMRFDPGATTVDTPAEEAFLAHHGVCQDFSHIMITGLRALGIPAGYVSGFLRTEPPPGKPRLEGADAMHAWVRAWCGRETGWIEYDPTNATLARTDHIVVGYGRDYSDVGPIIGVLRTAGKQVSHQSVDVIAIGQQ